jgi:aminopeptidase N
MSTETKYLKDYQAPKYLVETVDLIFELTEDFTMVTTKLQICANGHDGSESLVLDGRELELQSVSLNGTVLSKSDYHLNDEQLIIPNPGSLFQVDTVVKIKPQNNTSLMGLYKSSGNFCTQCEPEGFRKITYYIDRPDNLAIFTVTIVADKKQYPTLLSNGNNIDSGIAENGNHWFKWHDPHKKSPHLFALVAGNFDVLDDEFITKSGRKVKLRLFVEPGNLDKCSHAMQALKQSMQWDEEVYGREYDLDIFMTVAVGDFNMGAMENKGLNIFNTKFILANQETATDTDFLNITRVVGHEYFHNWSGNRVGCRDWFQLSLKEGFTVFRDQIFGGDMSSPSVKRIQDVNTLRTMQFKEDAGPMSHPIRPASYIEINNFYTVTVYEKGAEVIRMLHTLLGPEKFREATDLYFSRFDGQAVTTDDFVDCMQEVSGLDLSQFRLWYSQSGTPNLKIDDEYDVENQKYTLIVQQYTNSTADQQQKQALHIPLRIGLLNAKGEQLPLQLANQAANSDMDTVLHVTDEQHYFEFLGVVEKPTPSLLRGFSAPVKCDYDYTDEQLILLLKHDADPFVRWEAGQTLALHQIYSLIYSLQAKEELSLNDEFVEVYRELLVSNNPDKAFIALLLTLPSEIYIADNMKLIDPLAIHRVREFVRYSLAQSLQHELLTCYQANCNDDKYNLSNQQCGMRALKNLCLSYLLLMDDHVELAKQQYYSAKNMTDKMAAFNSIVNKNCNERQLVLDNFYKQFKHDQLVIDKWFTTQALCKLPGTFDRVKQLMSHADFTLKNPNRVRSLVMMFTRMNPGQFHAYHDEPYQFLADIVMELDRVNPQIASRMVESLTHWKRYIQPHQDLMHEQLERISKQNLSSDTYEIVSKSLR